MQEYQNNAFFKDLIINISAYTDLEYLFKTMSNNWEKTSKEIITAINENNGKLAQYLNEHNFIYTIDQIQNNSKNKKQVLKQFHNWFDSLKIYKWLKQYGN